MYFRAQLSKRFREFEVDVDLSASRGEFVTLLGPSGSGKSTILMLLAGLLKPDSGKIWLNGKDITQFPPEKRDFGVVFQDKLLFPHQSVLENAAFGLKVRGQSLSPVNDLLKSLGLLELSKRNVESLSGGEKQRVAIARALAYSPRLLLLDEPLKELDAAVKIAILKQLGQIRRKAPLTTFYVTHDVEEAFFLSDRIYVIHNGKTVQAGRPIDVFNKPKNRFVADYFSPYELVRKGKRLLIARNYFADH